MIRKNAKCYVAIVFLLVVTCLLKNADASEWIFYDNETPYASSASVFQGVRFTLPEGVVRAPLSAIRFYFTGTEPCEVTVHIVNADDMTHIVEPLEHPALNGWNEMDVSAYEAKVPHNFYIVVESGGCGYPMFDDEPDAMRSFKGQTLQGLTARLSYHLLIQAGIGDPLYVATVRTWAVEVEEKIKIRVDKKKRDTESFSWSEEWTLYEDGSVCLGPGLYGRWQQKKGRFIILMDREDIREMIENEVSYDLSNVNVATIVFSGWVRKNGRCKGKLKAFSNAYVFEYEDTGTVILKRRLNGEEIHGE
jgi:hypothetical protein